MKLNEVSLSDYTYQRICVLSPRGEENLPSGVEAYVLRTYGERELAAEDGVMVQETGWLILRLV